MVISFANLPPDTRLRTVTPGLGYVGIGSALVFEPLYIVIPILALFLHLQELHTASARSTFILLVGWVWRGVLRIKSIVGHD